MAPIIKFATSSGSKKKEPRYVCKKILKVPGNGTPLMFPQQGPYGERCSVSRVNGLSIHLCLLDSSRRSPPTKCGEYIRSQSTEPQADGRPTYNGVQPGPQRGSFTTLQSLPQCHAAVSTIPSTLAWVDQSPVNLLAPEFYI
jgi:hypothetical protein